MAWAERPGAEVTGPLGAVWSGKGRSWCRGWQRNKPVAGGIHAVPCEDEVGTLVDFNGDGCEQCDKFWISFLAYLAFYIL
jgi:hypothetical protein